MNESNREKAERLAGPHDHERDESGEEIQWCQDGGCTRRERIQAIEAALEEAEKGGFAPCGCPVSDCQHHRGLAPRQTWKQRVEEQAAEIERLKEVEKLYREYDQDQYWSLKKRAEAAEAEVERLTSRNLWQKSIIEDCPRCTMACLEDDDEWPLAKLRAEIERLKSRGNELGRDYEQKVWEVMAEIGKREAAEAKVIELELGLSEACLQRDAHEAKVVELEKEVTYLKMEREKQREL